MLSELMDDNSAADIGLRGTSDPANYAFSGKVMLSTVLILSIVCILVAFFHIYSRWYLLRRSTTHNHRIPTTTTTTVTIQKQGLDPAVLKSLPTFTYSPTTITAAAAASLDCAICISEFEESETVRILPNCNHSFHLECIDMWFHSHTNCPLCRSPVQLPTSVQSPTDSVTVETGENLAVIVEVPVTTAAEERGMDIVTESEGGSNGFKLMAGPVRSLRRFLSI